MSENPYGPGAPMPNPTTPVAGGAYPPGGPAMPPPGQPYPPQSGQPYPPQTYPGQAPAPGYGAPGAFPGGPAPQPAKPGNPLLWVVIALGVVALGLAVGLVLSLVREVPTPSPITVTVTQKATVTQSAPPAETVTVTESAPPSIDPGLDPMRLRTGDCFIRQDLVDRDFGGVLLVRCSEPHDSEVFLAMELPDSEQYPSDDQVNAWIDQYQPGAFGEYVGIPMEQSDLTPRCITPGEYWWSQGDRMLVCYAQSDDMRTKSIRVGAP